MGNKQVIDISQKDFQNIEEVQKDYQDFKNQNRSLKSVKEEKIQLCCHNGKFLYSERSQWLDHLEQECYSYQLGCKWTLMVTSSLSQFQGYLQSYYKQEFQYLNEATSAYRKQGLRNSHYNSDLIREIFFRRNNTDISLADSKNQNVDLNTIKRLMNKSYLIADDAKVEGNEFFIQNENNNLDTSIFSQIKEDSHSSFVSNSTPSFIYQNFQQQQKEKPNDKEYIHYLRKYVAFVEMIKMHCNDSKCVLNHIIQVFIQTQQDIYQPIIQRFQNITDKEYQTVLENSIYEIQVFIKIFQETIVFYYSIDTIKMGTFNFFQKDNILNFVTSIIFEKQQLYDLYYSIVSKNFESRQIQFQSIIKQKLTQDIEQFQVKKEFQLNHRTIEHLINKGKLDKNQQFLVKVGNQNHVLNLESIEEFQEQESLKDSYIQNQNYSESNQSIKNSISVISQQQSDQNEKNNDKQDKVNQKQNLTFQNLNESNDEEDQIQIKDKKQNFPNEKNNTLSRVKIQNLSKKRNKVNTELIQNVMDLGKRKTLIEQVDVSLGKPQQINEKEQEQNAIISLSEKTNNQKNKNIFTFTNAQQKIIDNFLKGEPYYDAIKSFKGIQKKLSPVSKMRAILKAAEKQMICIKKFYNNLGIEQEPLLDNGDVLDFLIYVTCKSCVSDIETHLYLIENFQTDSTLVAVSGLYLQNLRSAMEIIFKV